MTVDIDGASVRFIEARVTNGIASEATGKKGSKRTVSKRIAIAYARKIGDEASEQCH